MVEYVLGGVALPQGGRFQGLSQLPELFDPGEKPHARLLEGIADRECLPKPGQR